MEEYEKLQIKYNQLFDSFKELKVQNQLLEERLDQIVEGKIVPLRKIIVTLKQTINNLLQVFEE